MRLTPNQVLSQLGIKMPDEGIEINTNDAFLINNSLLLLGKTMSVSAIQDDDLELMAHGLTAIVAGARGKEENQVNCPSAVRLREVIDTMLNTLFKG